VKDVGYVLTALRSTYQFIHATFLTSLDSGNVFQPMLDLRFIGHARNKHLIAHSYFHYSIAYRPLQHLKTFIKPLLKTKLLVGRVVVAREICGMVLLARVPVAWMLLIMAILTLTTILLRAVLLAILLLIIEFPVQWLRGKLLAIEETWVADC